MVIGSDRRTEIRHEVVLRVAFASGKAFSQEYARNISKGGILIYAKNPPKPQAKVLVCLEIPSIDEPVELSAEVVHIIPGKGDKLAGVGLQFVEIPPDVRQLLERVISEVRGTDAPASSSEKSPPNEKQTGKNGDEESANNNTVTYEVTDEGAEGDAETDAAIPPMYQQIEAMASADKISFAAKASREARVFLLRDRNPTVINQVLRNPRLGTDEVMQFLKTGSPSVEAIKYITSRTEWMGVEEIKRALIQNPHTPLPIIQRFLPMMTTKDLRALAKSTRVRQQVKTAALRLYLERHGSKQ